MSASATAPTDERASQRSSLLAAKQVGSALLQATRRVVAKEGIAWTSPAGRSALAGTGSVLRSLLRGAVRTLSLVELPDRITTDRFSSALVSGEMNVSASQVVVRGLDTLSDFRVEAHDREHFTSTSTIDSLNSSMVVDLRARMLLGRLLRTEPVEARFAAVSQLLAVRIVIRWHAPLTPELLAQLLRVDRVAPVPASGQGLRRALRLRAVSVDVHIGEAVVALQPDTPPPDALGASAPLMWRLASSACAAQLREVLEVKLAQRVREAIRELEG